MIFGDDQYLQADLMDDESVVIKPTDEFCELINSMVRDLDMLHDMVCDLTEQVEELKELKRIDEDD